jgi:RNA 2',3'-cyclic 3'-phosphodiesterase
MPTQLELAGFGRSAEVFVPEAIEVDTRRLRDYLLYLAIFPRPEEAEHLSRAAADICRKLVPEEEPTPAEKLHVTLRVLGRYDTFVPQVDIDRALAAGANVACPELPFVFDRVGSLERGGHALVWHCDATTRIAFARLEQALATSLGHRPSNQEPHMTLVYQPEQTFALRAIEPLHWTATRFALILSHRGLGHHQWIGEWALNAKAASP